MVGLAGCSTSDPATRPPTTPRDDELHIAEVNFADLAQANDRYLRDLGQAVDGGRSSHGWRRRDADRAIVAEAEDFIENGEEFDDAAALAVWRHTSGRVAVQLTASQVGESPITATVLLVPDRSDR
jgi:hypothetical protein